MTPSRKQIIQWAREADLAGEAGRLFFMATMTPETLARFAALVAQAVRADEQNRCCRIVTGLCISDNNAQEITDAIRARRS